MRALDLFAGARGWDVAAETMGWSTEGVEIMLEARATAAAAGLKTVGHDVRAMNIERDQYDLLFASPPCQTYSMAGNGEGRRNLTRVLSALHDPEHLSDLDERTGLVLEPLRVTLQGLPRALAWEQVPAVLPVWEACAVVLRDHGYSVATGVLNAEQYGVPQTRRRAVLVARRDGASAALPVPTHSRYHIQHPTRLDAGVLPWVSMATALGWTPDMYVVSNYGTGGDPRNRGERTALEPSATITSKADRMKVRQAVKSMGSGMVERHGSRPGRAVDLPAFTVRGLAGGMEPGGFQLQPEAGGFRKLTEEEAATLQTFPTVLRNGNQAHACVRPLDSPAGTLFFGKRANWMAWERGEQRRKIEPSEAATLQTFPAGWPFQGGKSRRMEQIGNAVPPVLAAAILKRLVP